MNVRHIPGTDLKVSEISFGCWTMGGPNWSRGAPVGWGEVREEEVEAGIKAGLDAGVNHFDNADVYGNGKAERMLARALRRLGVASEPLVIATKVGHLPGSAEHAYEPAHIRHQCEQSLLNLQRDALDIYYFHHGDFGPGDRYLAGAVEMMNRLMREGKVRVIGLSAYSAADFERLVPQIKPRVLQSWAHALDDQFIREGSPVARLMAQRDLVFVAFSPLAQGRLLDKFSAERPPVFEPGDIRGANDQFGTAPLAKLKPKLEQLKARFGDRAEDLAAVALRYVLAHPRVACVIPGFRNERQARCNLAGVDRGFTADDIAYIRRVCRTPA